MKKRNLAAIALAALLLFGGLEAAADDGGGFPLLDRVVQPGTKQRVSFLVEPSFVKDSLGIIVLVARGVRPGPTLCLTGAVHGDELNGVEIAHRVYEGLDATTLNGTLVAVPIVNVWGFTSGNRYVADRRDLNRAFPGNPNGSLASRIAFAVFDKVITRCDALIDLHTGSDKRTNLPQVRVDFANEPALGLAAHFDVGIVLEGAGPEGSLRRSAVDHGVPAIIYEAGGPDRFERDEIVRGIEGVRNVMEQLDMVSDEPPPINPQRTFRSSSWVRAGGGGIFLTDRVPGDAIEKGAVLGTVTDPISGARDEIVAPFTGTLLGMAHPQVVLPGFGLFHVGRNESGGELDPSEDGE